MTKNGKIALGCGGAGCLGLIVVAIAGAVIYYVSMKPNSSRYYNFNVSNVNRNSNSNSTSNLNSNSNTNGSPSTGSSSSMSDDDKHKLYQAATMTGDTELIRRVTVKLGLMKEDFTPGEEYVSFLKDHVIWAFSNGDFIKSLDSKEKAMAYVNAHMD
ncbi:MAG TPA: hypothetical protein VI306_13205 [Pyrinomonadaceae bacterium]